MIAFLVAVAALCFAWGAIATGVAIAFSIRLDAEVSLRAAAQAEVQSWADRFQARTLSEYKFAGPAMPASEVPPEETRHRVSDPWGIATFLVDDAE